MHVTLDSNLLEDLMDGQELMTLNGSPLTVSIDSSSPTVTVIASPTSNATIEGPNRNAGLCADSVIHEIDAVLIPPALVTVRLCCSQHDLRHSLSSSAPCVLAAARS